MPWRPAIEQRLGHVAAAAVHLREVIKQALHHNAVAVLLTHNQLSELAESSQADIEITPLLQEALKMVEVRLLDYVAVSAEESVSLAENGCSIERSSLTGSIRSDTSFLLRKQKLNA